MILAHLRFFSLALVLLVHSPSAQDKLAPPSIRTLGTSLPITCNSRLGGVATGADGSIFISNFINQVWHVQPGGETKLLATNLQGSSGNASFHGDLLQSSFNDNRILRITTEGEQSIFASTNMQGPVGLAVNRLDEVFVCSFKNNALVCIDADGNSELVSSGGHLNGPNGIAIGPDELPYVVNYNDTKVLRLTIEGEMELLAELPGAGNAHIAWAQGAFFITSIGGNKLYRLALDGSYELFAGTGQPGLDDGALDTCSLNAPNGIAATWDGRALVMNNIRGTWKSRQPAELVLRQIDLVPPAEAQPQQLELERGQVHVGELCFDYLAAGPAKGEPVLLLHGFPQTGYCFRSQLRALAERGYRAVAPDQRGYSPGARPLEVSRYGLATLAADALGIAQALGFERFHLVGHDWGGAVAWLLASRHPGRLRSLSVLSTPHYAAMGAQLRDPSSNQAKQSSYMAGLAAEGAEDELLKNDAARLRACFAGLDLDAEDVQVYVDALGSREALRGALNWYRAMGPRGRASSSSSSAAASKPGGQTPRIDVPTLYMWGTEDSAFARDCAEDSADYVAAYYRFVPLTGIGHWLPEGASEQVNQALIDHIRQADDRR